MLQQHFLCVFPMVLLCERKLIGFGGRVQFWHLCDWKTSSTCWKTSEKRSLSWHTLLSHKPLQLQGWDSSRVQGGTVQCNIYFLRVKKKKKKKATVLQKLSSNWTGKVSHKFQSGNLMEYTTLQVIFDVFNLLWWLVLRDLCIYSGAWIIHNRCGCRCKLIIYLASGVFSHVKTYL